MKRIIPIIITPAFLITVFYGTLFHPTPKTGEEPSPDSRDKWEGYRTDEIRSPSNQESPADGTPPTTPSAKERGAEKTEAAPTRHVPFIVQAPGSAWHDPIFQDGCEEASMLMVAGRISGTETVPEETAAADIRSIASFETGRFGHHEDISLAQVAETLRDRLGIGTAEIVRDISIPDLITALSDGKAVLAPAYGRALGNPHFTPPGPITHMLVLTGHDPETREFIVNDPGTRHGEGYRYDESVLFDAIWAYPSGPTHPEPPEADAREKSVVTVSGR